MRERLSNANPAVLRGFRAGAALTALEGALAAGYYSFSLFGTDTGYPDNIASRICYVLSSYTPVLYLIATWLLTVAPDIQLRRRPAMAGRLARWAAAMHLLLIVLFQNADLIIIGIQSLLYAASSVLLALVVRGLILHVPDPRLGGWLLWLAVGCAAVGAPAAAVYLYGCQSVLVTRTIVAAGLTANVSWVVLLCLCYREFTRAEAISLRHCRPDE